MVFNHKVKVYFKNLNILNTYIVTAFYIFRDNFENILWTDVRTYILGVIHVWGRHLQ